MSVGSERDLKGLWRVGRVVAETLRLMVARVRAGITTADLDRIATEFLATEGARSAPRLVYDFPGSTCISINDEAVHGIPGTRLLEPGDLVKCDVTAELDGYFADAAVTVPIPPVSDQARRLVACAEAAFWEATRVARAGVPLSTVGRAVETEVRRWGFHVLRDLCGHGIGRNIHEHPSVLNYDNGRRTPQLTRGLVIALEPIVSVGTDFTRTAPDGWTIHSRDGSLTAHFEHTLIIDRSTPHILTAA